MGDFVEVCEFDSNPRLEARRFVEKVRNSIQESLEMSTENLTEKETETILFTALQERSFRVVMEQRYNEIVKSLAKEINQRLTLESEKIVSELVDRAFSTVFGNQMNSLCKNSGAEAEIEYTIKNKTNHMLFQNNGCCELVNSIAFLNKAIYIDNPFIVDELSEGVYREFGTGNILKELLLQKRQDDEHVIESVLTREKIDIVFDKLQNIVPGDIERTPGRNFYLASVNENNSVEIRDVREDIDQIYQKMTTPIQILETLRYEMNNN